MFWSSLVFIFYTYAGYPLQLWVHSRFRRIVVPKDKTGSFVSVVVSVLNEEKNIRERLDNLLSQDYPANKIEIIIVSDGSTDKTCEIVRGYAGDKVRLIELGDRKGKAFALNAGTKEAKGEIVVFSDARQRFEPDVISHLVANFSDPQVGCVSGELVFIDDAESRIRAEMGAYWKYEKWIRKMESLTGSVVGATGAIFAVRRNLFQQLPAGAILDDVMTPLNVVLQGYRCIFDGSAVAYDTISKDAAQEWRRKVRTLAGNWQMLDMRPALLFPWRNPCWWRLLSHKIMRLIVPFALVSLFVSAAVLAGRFYRAATVVQVMFYAAASTGAFVPAARRMRLVNLSYFFLVMNAAAVCGFWWWITGRSAAAWQPAATGKCR